MDKPHRQASVIALLVTLLLVLASAAAVAASVIVTDPNVLPPPGTQYGWVDYPCSDQVRYDANWVFPAGQTFTGTAVIAHSMIVSSFGVPVMTMQGSDVITTFSATLDARIALLFDDVQNPPLREVLPGTMTVRLVGKAGHATGTFLIVVEAMEFKNNTFLVRLDMTRPSRGVITVGALGGSQYTVDCGVDIYSTFSVNPGLNPPQWSSDVADVNAPTHYELLSASCAAAGSLLADFSYSPASPAKGAALTFADLSTGGATAWAWTFGDGTASNERNPCHTYTAPGTYAVRLTVTKTGATASKSVAIEVRLGGPRPRRALHGAPAS